MVFSVTEGRLNSNRHHWFLIDTLLLPRSDIELIAHFVAHVRVCCDKVAQRHVTPALPEFTRVFYFYMVFILSFISEVGASLCLRLKT